MVEEKLRVHFGDYLGKAEVVIYSVLAVLLFITALATIANAAKNGCSEDLPYFQGTSWCA